jgi:glutamine cyclotransferase
MRATLLLCLALAAICACSHEPPKAGLFGYQVVHEFPHDPEAYCQGLVFDDGRLYESTGRYGQSTVREVELATGKVVRSTPLAPELFGEGLALWNESLVQVTWKSQRAFVYRRDTLARVRELTYVGEGWGLTQDGEHLILSDGTDQLRFLDPNTLREVRRVGVTNAKQPVRRINELEYVRGEIFANIWQTNLIARIDPRTGVVNGWIDLSGLHRTQPGDDPDSVLNGIAYDAAGDRLFVTGKLWPRLYEIALVKK